MAARLASHLLLGAIRRLVEAEGGFATVARRGDAEAGDMLLIVTDRHASHRLLRHETLGPDRSGWRESAMFDDSAALAQALARHSARDPDLWIVELDVADSQRLIVLLTEQT